MTALAADIGTGNVVGVALAIAVGGPGALFWMWVTALVGMMTKFSEVLLAVHFRERTPAGNWVGGAMFFMAFFLLWRDRGLWRHAGLSLLNLLSFAVPVVIYLKVFLADTPAPPVEYAGLFAEVRGRRLRLGRTQIPFYKSETYKR